MPAGASDRIKPAATVEGLDPACALLAAIFVVAAPPYCSVSFENRARALDSA